MQARYVDRYAGAKGRFCMRCAHFKNPDSCDLVWGKISPLGSCRLWEKREPKPTTTVAVVLPDLTEGRR